MLLISVPGRSLFGRVFAWQQEVPTDSFAWKDHPCDDKAMTENPKTKEKGRRGNEEKHSEGRLKTSGLGSPYPDSTNGNCSYNSFVHESQRAGGGSGWKWTQTDPSSRVNSTSYEMCDFGQIP
uniref:Uncharacterized protein n=1 Tax=Molossus molossus TaxID=27622 RepID=A0A7J8EE89_MOLMO|nr:hypothetical protein HJG59_008848 [Molossus molossus]